MKTLLPFSLSPTHPFAAACSFPQGRMADPSVRSFARPFLFAPLFTCVRPVALHLDTSRKRGFRNEPVSWDQYFGGDLANLKTQFGGEDLEFKFLQSETTIPCNAFDSLFADQA